MTPRELLYDLVSTPSVSGGEGEAAAVLVEYFEDAGREAWIDDAGNVRAPGDDGVLLTSHIDTVPGWIDVREEERTVSGTAAGDDETVIHELWGRGSVDATGPLAAMATASVESGASFVGVVEEETGSAGARHLVETREEPDAVVNGEPSGWDAVTLGYRGFVAATYEVETTSAHSSRPEPNAVQRAVAWTERVQDAFASTAESQTETPVFESVTVKPIDFDGGLADDGRAVEATVEVQFRLPPGTTATDVQSAVEECTARAQVGAVEDIGSEEDGPRADEGDAEEHGVSETLTWGEPIPPVMSSPRTPVAGALRAGIRDVNGDPTHLRKTGTSDANLYAAAWDCPVATYGPGDSSRDHAPDERINLADFDRGVDVLTTAADRLCTS